MNHSNGRLILKVKKRRNSFPVSKVIIETEKENINARVQRGKKRLNPFSKNEPSEKVKLCNLEQVVEEDPSENSFFAGLEKYGKNFQSNYKPDICTKFLQEHDVEEESDDKKALKKLDTTTTTTEAPTCTHETATFPLDWSIKNRARFLSRKPFKFNSTKAVDECNGIHQFTTLNTSEEPCLNQSLYNWIHPSIPGIPNYPLKTKMSGGVASDDKIVNTLSNSAPLQECFMKQWRNSFQSLFNMLKNKYCSYFYMCTYQFTIIFKAAGFGSKLKSAVMGPTTKGLRDMLTEEGISFEFMYKEESKASSKEIEFGFEGDYEKWDHDSNTPSLNTSYEEDFLDSIGLNKKEHFPSIEAQQRLTMKSRLRSVDNRLESTIKIKNCQGLFNFLLNANFLCSPSGAMTGVPPTLISPSPFEGGTLCKCKISNGPIKQQRKSSTQTVYCIDVNGVLIPGQTKGLVDVLTKGLDEDDVLRIQMKTFDMLHCLNGDIDSNAGGGDCLERASNHDNIPLEMKSFLSQKPIYLSDNSDVVFTNNLFKF